MHAPPLAPGVTRESFLLPAEPGRAIRGEALLPRRARAGVILLHGFKGFSRWGFFPWLAGRIAAAGMNAITFDFSGSGIGEDGESFTDLDAFEQNSFTKELRDIALVEAEAKKRRWIEMPFGLFGHSRGGGMAVLHAARNPEVGALVTWSAIGTIARYSDEERARWRERGYAEVPNSRTGQILRVGTGTLDDIEQHARGRLDISAAAERIAAPWLVIHGTGDETVPYTDAEDLAQAVPSPTRRLMLVDGAGHTFDITHPLTAMSPALERVTKATADFFKEHLR